LTVTISTNAVDRSGDIVEPNGGKFVNFKKNPVVLMAHDYSGLPIGKASDLKKTEKGITAKVTFPEEGTYPLADTVYNMYKQKFMRAWSIGFIPIKSEEITAEDDKNKKGFFDGRRYKTWELLEFSACAVPANPEALTNMVSKGIDIGLLQEEGLIEIVEGKDIEKVEDKIANDDPRLLVPLDVTKEIIKDALKDVKVEPIDPDKVIASIEKDDKEYDINELINRISEINIENKDLKEKLASYELKAGAVLNAKNKKYLADSLTNIQAVLDSAGTTEESIKDVDEIDYDKGDDNVIEITHDTVDDILIDETKAEPTVIELNEFEVDDKAIDDLIDKKLNYALGRVSK
jgi:HK97 family phage prohead protease